jgi:uncharacterized protein
MNTPHLSPLLSLALSPCPICRKPEQEKYRPFCSQRCEQIDLHTWFTGGYALPTEEEMPDDDNFSLQNKGDEQ